MLETKAERVAKFCRRAPHTAATCPLRFLPVCKGRQKGLGRAQGEEGTGGSQAGRQGEGEEEKGKCMLVVAVGGPSDLAPSCKVLAVCLHEAVKVAGFEAAEGKVHRV